MNEWMDGCKKERKMERIREWGKGRKGEKRDRKKIEKHAKHSNIHA
jgi:hypothetical protein